MAEREVIESFEGKPLYYSIKCFPLIFALGSIDERVFCLETISQNITEKKVACNQVFFTQVVGLLSKLLWNLCFTVPLFLKLKVVLECK